MNEPTFSTLTVRYQADTDSWEIPCDDGEFLYVRRDMMQYAPDDVYAIVSERVKRFRLSMIGALADPPWADILQFPIVEYPPVLREWPEDCECDCCDH